MKKESAIIILIMCLVVSVFVNIYQLEIRPEREYIEVLVPEHKTAIVGIVYWYAGYPHGSDGLQGVKVTLDGRICYTYAFGDFTFTDVEWNNYEIRFEKEGYYNEVRLVTYEDCEDGDGLVFIEVEMKPTT